MRRSIAATLLCLTANLAAATSQLELRHREKNGVGYTQGYTTADYLLTHSFGKPEILLNLRGHIFDDGRFASNAGLGFRYPVKDDKWLLGINAFYDFRESKHLLANQAGAGIEILKRKIDFRINGYLPFGDRVHEHKRFSRFTGNEIIVRQKGVAALPCAEFEIGLPLTRHFYLAAAPYYLFKERKSGLNFGNAWGGKMRFTIDLDRYFSIGAAATYDPIFKTTVQGMIAFRIPFGKFPKETPRKKRNLREVPIFRNEIIPLEKKKRETALFHGGDGDEADRVEIVFVNNTSAEGGDGSFEAPFSSLKDAEAASQPGDIIYVFPGDGTAANMDEGIVLQENQVLASSGAPITIEDVEIPPHTPGETPVITNIHPDEPVVANPGETRLEDFEIIEPWEYLLESWSLDYDYSGIDAGIGGPAAGDVGAADGGPAHEGGGPAAAENGDGGNDGFVDLGDIDAHPDNGAGDGGSDFGVDAISDGDGAADAGLDLPVDGGLDGVVVDVNAGDDGAGAGDDQGSDGGSDGSFEIVNGDELGF